MRARQKVSRAGVELIKSFEGLRSTAARLPDGRWTLGYGHTFSARDGARVTQEDADALLRFDLLPVVDAINNVVLVPLNQNQFDALVSFCFNIGVDNFAQSSVLKCINEGRVTEAALAMDSWRSAEFNGQTYVLAPLIRRRAAEKNLFLTPEDSAGNAPSLLVRPTVDTAGDAAARPSELNSPDRGGVLSAYPMGEPGLSPYAQPAPQPLPTPYAQPVAQPAPYVAPAPAPAPYAQPVNPYAQPERQVIDLNAYTPRAPEPVAATPQPYAAPSETVHESLPEGLASSFLRETPAEDAVPQLSPAMQAALAQAQEEHRLEAERLEQQRLDQQRMREEAERQAAALTAARADEEARLQAHLENERLEREREAAARYEQQRLEQQQRFEQERADAARAEQARLDQERLDRDRAAQTASAFMPPAAVAAPVAAAALDDEAEKARKAEAAAALLRLYSPYGGGALGRPLAPAKAPEPAPQPVAAPVPAPAQAPAMTPTFTPYEPKPLEQGFSNQSTLSPAAAASAPIEETPPAPQLAQADDHGGSVVDFMPIASPRTMPPPQVTALNPYGRPAAEPAPAVVEVARPQAVDLSAQPVQQTAPAQPEQPLHWREQLQRPLPADYQSQPVEQPSLVNASSSHFESLYNDDNEDWTSDGSRIAVAADETHHEPVSWWRMIVDTLWMVVISGLGLACLGVASAAYFKSHDATVIRNGFLTDYTSLSLIMAVVGVLFVSIAVWLIMKRLGGLKD